jgi:hypothetical protein
MAKAKTSKKKKSRRKGPVEQEVTPEPTDEEVEGAAPAATATVEPAEGEEATEEESTHAKYERIKKGNLYLTDLQRLTVAEPKTRGSRNTARSRNRI